MARTDTISRMQEEARAQREQANAVVISDYARMQEAANALRDAVAAYADALYAHNIGARMVAPRVAYREVRGTLESDTTRFLDDTLLQLQSRITAA